MYCGVILEQSGRAHLYNHRDNYTKIEYSTVHVLFFNEFNLLDKRSYRMAYVCLIYPYV